MKRFICSTKIMLMALVMALCSTGAVYASSNPTSIINEEVSTYSNSYPYPSMGRALVTTTSWKKIAESNTGFGCNVYIKCSNTATSGFGVVPSDIRMLGKNNNIVWEESGAIPGQGSRIFICGKDVYEIQIRTQAGQGTAYAYETTASPT